MSEPELLLATRRFDVVRMKYLTADGVEHAVDTIQHLGAVAILPLLPDGRICLIRNFRVAVGQTLIELPAGTREPGETPLETAHRELAEETGYQAQSMESLGEILMSPGILHERMYLFLATGLTMQTKQLALGEVIESHLVSLDEALEMIQRGEILDAKTIVGLLKYDRWHR
jgi:ADP-ribose pyrophosphatase